MGNSVTPPIGWGFSVTLASYRQPSRVRHPDHRHRVVVPMHGRDLEKGTLNQIVDA